jgi:hypothetical protein
MHLAPYFDNGKTTEAITRIDSEFGIRIERAPVRKLVDFGTLVAVESQPYPSISNGQIKECRHVAGAGRPTR